MTQGKVAVNRTLVGLLALACLVLAAVLFVGFPNHESGMVWQSALFRVGLVMAAFWMALPSREREAAWTNISWTTLCGLLLVVVAVARFKYAVFPVLATIAAIGFVLRPRAKRRPGDGRLGR